MRIYNTKCYFKYKVVFVIIDFWGKIKESKKKIQNQLTKLRNDDTVKPVDVTKRYGLLAKDSYHHVNNPVLSGP